MKRLRLFCSALSAVVLLFAGIAAAQEKPVAEDAAQAVALYEKGERETAFKLFDKILKERPNDTEVLYRAGLYRQREKFEGAARLYFERLIVLQPQRGDVWAALAHFRWLASEKPAAADAALKAIEFGVDTAPVRHAIAENYLANRDYERALSEADDAIKKDSQYFYARITKHFALLGLKRTNEAAANLEQLIRITDEGSIWDDELKRLRAVIERNRVESALPDVLLPLKEGEIRGGVGAGDARQPPLAASKSETLPLRIVEKVRARYTERARKAGATGNVVLQVLFSADKKISVVRVVNYLPCGLTEQAVAAARLIQFEPKTVNGVHISVAKNVEYIFKMY